MSPGNPVKRAVRRLLGTAGYSIRHVGIGVTGVELLRDARILLKDRSEPILFDVGANLGQTTQAMLDTFESATIVAFEPSPMTATALRRRFGNRRGVTIETMALGSAAGTMPFHVTRDHSVNDSLLTPTWAAGGTTVEVRVDTVDEYCSGHHIESIDVLKIDAQGYDLHVLHGALRMLESRRVRLFSCEANFEALYAGQARLNDLLAFADKIDYRLIGFYEQTYVDDTLTYLDMLFSAD